MAKRGEVRSAGRTLIAAVDQVGWPSVSPPLTPARPLELSPPCSGGRAFYSGQPFSMSMTRLPRAAMVGWLALREGECDV